MKRENFVFFRTGISYWFYKRAVKKYVASFKNSSFSLLDIGCGYGLFLRHMQRWFPGCRLHGVDIDTKSLEAAKAHLKDVQLLLHDAHELPFDTESFDVVSALHLVEHLPHPEKLIVEAARLLKPDGLFIAATPNPRGLCARILKDRWNASRCSDHISLKSPSQWRSIIEKTGLTVICEGTTGLSGFRLLHRFPLAVFNWLPLALFGCYPWLQGEAYIAISIKLKRGCF